MSRVKALIPATIGPFVLGKMGEAFARQVLFTARPFDADFLNRAGLVAQVCKGSDLEEAIEAEVRAVLQCAPGAVAGAKALCRTLTGRDPGELAQMTAAALADRWETDEAQDGIRAFFEKRPPPWKV